MSSSLPIISLLKLMENDVQEIEKLGDVCRDHGFIYLKDHGVSLTSIRDAVKASRRFFELPDAIKHNYGQSKQQVQPTSSRGYVPLGGEKLYGGAEGDPKEIFDFGFDRPPSDEPFTGPNVIPDDAVAPDFKRSLYALQDEVMSKVTPNLLQAFARALGLDADWFQPFFSDPVLLQRAIYYPANSGKAGKHTDNGIFTILIQEPLPAPSLRVFTQDHWIDAPCHEEMFVINLGDMLQRWTDGRFISTPHEVLHTLPMTRISLPFFVYPNIDSVIEPFGSDEKISTKAMMLENFNAIWVDQKGAGMKNGALK